MIAATKKERKILAADEPAPPAAAADDLAELDAALKRATPGPWRVLDDPAVDACWLNADGEVDKGAIALFDYRTLAENEGNAGFVVVARHHLPKLIDEMRQLRLRVRQLLEANGREVERRSQAQRERDEALARLKELGKE